MNITIIAIDTTAAGLRAGILTLIIPHFADQPFWGRRVYALGGAKPVPRHKLTVDKLGRGIETAVGDPQIRQYAAALATKIRAEDGIRQAIKAFNSIIR